MDILTMFQVLNDATSLMDSIEGKDKKKTALMYACERGHINTIKKLIEYENINDQDSHGLMTFK